MMPKKKKKKRAPAEAQQETQAEAGATGQVGAETEPEPPTPVTIPGQEIPVEPGAAAGKKKKKSRAQVALNTLRSEGVEAFGAYIEAEIGETELLHNLHGRLLRAEDLGAARIQHCGLSRSACRAGYNGRAAGGGPDAWICAGTARQGARKVGTDPEGEESLRVLFRK